MKINKMDESLTKIAGLFYASFIILGMTVGAIVGFFLADGFLVVNVSNVVKEILSIFVGILIGLSCGLISHAIVLLYFKRKSLNWANFEAMQKSEDI